MDNSNLNGGQRLWAADAVLKWLIVAVLMLGLGLRLFVVMGGGQLFWPDEGRYFASLDAVHTIKHGDFKLGLTSLVSQGDHVGFKLLGLIPASFQSVFGVRDLKFAAAFFTIFSWSGLWFFWGWIRRLGASREAQLWTMVLVVSCTSLTFYTRHLLPYDASLALVFAALYFGGHSADRGYGRGYLAGIFAGAAALVYLGYWLLVAIAMGVGLLDRRAGLKELLRQGSIRTLGFATPLLGVWGVDQWGSGTMIENTRRFSGSITQGDFGVGYRLVWEYFWHAEGLLLIGWIAGFAFVLVKVASAFCRGQKLPAVWAISALIITAIYGGLLFTSDIVNKFVVYGRLARQLAPFFCLVGGLAISDLLSRRKRREVGAALVGFALLVNGFIMLGPVVEQEFPPAFKARAEELLKSSPSATPGVTYYRYVGVDDYLFEAEKLPYAPEETLLVARHPYEFKPYHYEGASAEVRALRRAADQRMKLVLMRPPAALLVNGEDYGLIKMMVKFPPKRGGRSEPLLSVGPPHIGDLFFVRFVSEKFAVFGMECEGRSVIVSEPIEIELERSYEMTFFSGTMLEPLGNTGGEEDAIDRINTQNLVRITLDGKEVLRGMIPPHRAAPDEVYPGYNFVRATSASNAFSGEISQVTRGGYPLERKQNVETHFGAVKMSVVLPAAAAGVPEPLLVIGMPGNASLCFVRVIPGGKAKLGVEFWGVGSYESEELVAPSDVTTEVELRIPALYPPVGDARWGDISPATQQSLRSHVTLLLNGRTALHREIVSASVEPAPTSYGFNHVGGSWVYPKFTGQLQAVSRAKLDEL
jgi:hypothetical protein